MPLRFTSDSQLDDALASPHPETVEAMGRLAGDVVILGVGGKMGPSLAWMAKRACEQAGVTKRIVGVSRFSDPAQREWLEDRGVETIACDLADPEAVAELPVMENIFFLAGRKFGERGSEGLTWVMNTVVPANVARHFRGARTVVFSTGCVYELLPPESKGSKETDPPKPVGEYANSCLGRERLFEHYAREFSSPTLVYRLNYAIDLRYGVLVDIAERILAGEPVDLAAPAANVIWQGDANNRALLCLERTALPPEILNITGPELLSVKDVALHFGKLFEREVSFTGEGAGRCYLSDASKSFDWFGPPKIGAEELIEMQAHWLLQGGRRLGKPTHFTVTDGQFLD